MIILDIDNCIADDAWRIPMIDWERSGDARYHTYHSLAPWDAVGNRTLYHGEREVIVLTGRPVLYRPLTEEWLRRAGVHVKHLMMRNNNDLRRSPKLKRAMLEALVFYDVTPLRDVRVAYDDHPEIVKMYRDYGLKAEQVSIHNVCAYTNTRTGERHP